MKNTNNLLCTSACAARQAAHILKALLRDVSHKRLMDSVSLLTYSTLLATVPVVAVIFAIARGFGYNKYIETWFRSALDSQPQVVEVIIGFVNSYLVHTKSGIVFGFGLLFMLWTVIMLTRNIERVFNNIWNVSSQRSITRTFTDFMAMFFVLPIMIIVNSGVTLWMTSLSSIIREQELIGPLLRFSIDIMPTLIMAGIMTLLFIFMPNTQVRWRHAIIPGLLTALCMQLLQYFYIHSQLWVSGYNAVYGSFAALPLFMLWIQFTWTIILFGAELSYACQNITYLQSDIRRDNISHLQQQLLSAVLLSKICMRTHQNSTPYTHRDLYAATGMNKLLLNFTLDTLIKTRLIAKVDTGDSFNPAYLPAENVEDITLGKLVSRLDSMHPWSATTDIKALVKSDAWAKVISSRTTYMKDLYNIKMYEIE